MNSEKLTGKNFWETYWKAKSDKKKNQKPSLSVIEIRKAFDRYLPDVKDLMVLEIGGAKGEYLLYLVRRFGYKAYSLDYSGTGNDQTMETFREAGLQVSVYERDFSLTTLTCRYLIWFFPWDLLNILMMPFLLWNII